jgi:phage tail-like protein
MARQDPLRNVSFRVEIDGVALAAFAHVTIGAVTTDVILYRDGTDPSHVRKLPGLRKFGNVTLKRGVTTSRDLFEWLAAATGGARRRVTIVVMTDDGADSARFEVSDAWPVKYEIGELCATGQEVLIESLELANEGIERVS